MHLYLCTLYFNRRLTDDIYSLKVFNDLHLSHGQMTKPVQNVYQEQDTFDRHKERNIYFKEGGHTCIYVEFKSATENDINTLIVFNEYLTHDQMTQAMQNVHIKNRTLLIYLRYNL